MDTARRSREAADANFVASYRKLVEHDRASATREFGGAFAFTTGLPISLFNGCLVVHPASRADLAAAIDWVAAFRLPFRVWIRDDLAPGLATTPLQYGLIEETRRYPGMALEPPPETPPLPSGVTVERVIQSKALAEHRGILLADGAPATAVRRLLPDTFLSDPDVAMITAKLDGQPVGTALAIRSGDVAGVYNVGTRPSARRRGVGAAATWAAVECGRRWGCGLVVLQSTELGQSVYEAMGFRTVVRYVESRCDRGEDDRSRDAGAASP